MQHSFPGTKRIPFKCIKNGKKVWHEKGGSTTTIRETADPSIH
jgi:hypothetical protein